MKPTATAESLTLALDSQVAGLRVMGSRQIVWFHKLFQGDANSISIGRTNQSDVRIRDQSVSRLHCMVERVEPGRYVIIDCLASNGLLVSPYGRFSDYQQVRSAELDVFMRIRLGRAKLAPVLADGTSPLIVSTEKMFALEAYEVYGSARAAQNHTGMKTRRLWPLVRQLREALSKRRRAKRSKKARR